MRRSTAAIVLVSFLVLLACAGFDLPIGLVLFAMIGWVFFLYRVIPQVQIAVGGVATAAVCLVLLAAGTHAFLGWLYDQIHGAKRLHGRWKPRWTAALISSVVLTFVAGIATVGITHQVAWLMTSQEPLFVSGGGAARRAQSVNNLKQVGLGLGNYAEANVTFPPGGTFDAQGQPLHSWMTRTLPFIEQSELLNSIDLEVAWDAPRNRALFQKSLNTYLNPAIRVETLGGDDKGYAPSHYAGNVHILGGDVARAPRDIKDGLDQTIMAGEAPAGFKAWGDPTNWRDLAKGLNRAPNGFGGPYSGGAYFTFADGSVKFLKNGTDPRVLQALGTPAGGETIAPEDY